ncbi:unnamed protein product (macronuclear) [Paramecium tetraurelia]|uniref:Protein kinase domain-containing protein n=1 Tax=Paramecium tetraurelia TaxID=5888 RepID=A0EAM5_PARTE|nr:uncharacterized protein GSPATT00025076001 [Paramecium tetraurelia]CAK92342.1 unnamed protein product [Paramecium tetraurelia]|eukprot:XP_001459739.1 hypothetical protein (macronuclear) [Paramecium tetraurelia strain d4-2]
MSEQQQQYWPIFTEKDEIKTFWNKKPINFVKQTISYQQLMKRISWKSNKPTEYEFLLSEEGVLFYKKNNKVKGYVQLNEDISLKLIDLKISNKKADAVKVIRIKRTKDIFLYIWNHDYQYTFQFLKYLCQFCFVQNLDELYTLQDVIGKGGFSKVYTLTPNIRLPNQPFNYAGKVYNKNELLSKKDLKKFYHFIRSECYILKRINFPYVLKLCEIIQLEELLILVTEYIKGGSLYQYLKERKRLSEIESTQILLKLALGLQQVHNLGYVHRDIKLENVLIDKDQLKLIDFGFAEKICRDRLVNGQGTAGYIAPEVFMKQPYQEVGDIFSLGVIFYSMLSGKAPFRSNTYDALLKLNKECQIEFSELRFPNVSQKTMYLLKAMLSKQPENRINLQDLLNQLTVCQILSPTNNMASTQSIVEGSVGISFNHLQSKNTLKSFYQNSQNSFTENHSQMSQQKPSKNLRDRRYKSQSLDKKGLLLKSSSFKPSLKNIYQIKIEQSDDNISITDLDQPIPYENLRFLQTSYQTLNCQKFI